MFDFLTDSVENGLSVVSDSWDGLLGDGPGPARRQVAKLIADGLTVAAVAEVYGVGVDVVESLMEGTNGNP